MGMYVFKFSARDNCLQILNNFRQSKKLVNMICKFVAHFQTVLIDAFICEELLAGTNENSPSITTTRLLHHKDKTKYLHIT